MNYKYYTIVILGLLAFSACEKDDIDIPATDNEVNQWIEQTMRENYLWYSEFPDKSSLDFSLDPETFFKGLLSDKDGKDLPEGHHYFPIRESDRNKEHLRREQLIWIRFRDFQP